jgi:hypothetical protein
MVRVRRTRRTRCAAVGAGAAPGRMTDIDSRVLSTFAT